MQLDDEVCYRAHRSRDARFDGRFFVAVLSTGIYCRPICPARQPLRKNLVYYISAAAAEQAGFRPCRRCRPDAAPGSPEWIGQSALTSRALRMIREGAMNEGGVNALAGRLGISARQLGRLFQEELGCSPIAMAQTVRAHLAHKLLTETNWSMTDVAFGAGYKSVRRFNTALKASFKRSPGELRNVKCIDTQFSLRLAYRPPLNWEHLLGFLGFRAIPGVEVVSDATYCRSVLQEGRSGWIEVRQVADSNVLELSTNLPASRGFGGLVERVRNLFDLRADPHAIESELGRDVQLRKLLAQTPGLRVPAAWDGFELAVRAVLGQQISVKGARTLLGRLVEQHGQPVEGAREGIEFIFPSPEVLASANLSKLGVPRTRIAALSLLAQAVLKGDLDLEPSADPLATRAALCAIAGIGPWTADYIAMRALRDPDAFPAGDLVLRRVASTDGEPMRERELREHSERWRPWRAYAALLLWNSAKDKPVASS